MQSGTYFLPPFNQVLSLYKMRRNAHSIINKIIFYFFRKNIFLVEKEHGKIIKLISGAFIFLFLFLTSCVSYYQIQYAFNSNFEQGNLPAANAALSKEKNPDKSKTKLLYYLNKGVVSSMLGKYEESNTFLERAHIIAEDYHINYMNEVASFLLNPNFTEYKGEDEEVLLINYYKALNYLKLGKNEEALVECKRMNIRLQQLGDKYSSDNKFKKDAFINVLMGIIYEANGEINDAFIAYRNAVNIYEKEYRKLFDLGAPEQLKKDLLRTAYLNGFTDELNFWQKQFNITFQPNEAGTGDLIFLWHNGLGPVKEQDGINFIINHSPNGFVNFSNADFGLNFSFPISDSSYHKSGLSRLEFIRVVFPKYIERPAYFTNAELQWNGKSFPLELAEDVNAIAFKGLKQRMVKEVGKSLLRLALKKAEEYSLRSKDQNAGALLGFFNALTEQADTRCWQSIPHSIYYCRVSLPQGQQNISFIPQSSRQNNNAPPVQSEFKFQIKTGKTIFHTFSSLETLRQSPPQGRY